MTTQSKPSSLQICCELVEQLGKAYVADLLPVCELSESCIRYCLANAVKLGYLEEHTDAAHRNVPARKAYRRTAKEFPQPTERERKLIADDAENHRPRRDWAVVALFGPYEARA